MKILLNKAVDLSKKEDPGKKTKEPKPIAFSDLGQDELFLLKHTVEATPLKLLKKWVKQFAKQRVNDDNKSKDTATVEPAD